MINEAIISFKSFKYCFIVCIEFLIIFEKLILELNKQIIHSRGYSMKSNP
jgi:hypothetical protein